MSHRPRPAAVLVTLLLAVGLLVAVPGPAQAAGCTVTWKGQTAGDWGDVANWTPAVIPGSTGRENDQVCVTSGNTVLLTTIGGGNYTVAAINGGAADGPSLELRGGTSLSIVGGAGVGATRLGGIRILANTLRIASGATVDATRLDIGNDGAAPPAVGRLDGFGTLNVAGPIAVTDGGAIYNTDIDNGDSSKLVINQTLPGATFVVDGRNTPAGRYTQMYGPKLTTASDIQVLGTTYWANEDVRTTGQLILAAGASINGGGRVTARGITVPAGGTTKVDTRLILTGATSSLGGDLNLCETQICGGGLEMTSSGRLTIPSGRTVVDHGWAADTPLAGQITGAGTLKLNGGIKRVTSTGVVSPGRLEARVGQFIVDTGATVSVDSLYLAGVNSAVHAAVTIGAGGLTLDSGGGFGGDGSVTVAGPVRMNTGAYTSAGAMRLVQTGAHPFDLVAPGGSVVLDAQTSTPNDVTLDGTLYLGGTLTTPGRFVLATGATVNGSTLVAGGVGFGAGAKVGNVALTGASSTFAGDAEANLVEVRSGGTLAIPAGRRFTVNPYDGAALKVLAGGTLAGSGTVVNAVRNEGTVAPGDAGAAGTLTVGRYTQTSTGVLRIAAGSGSSSRLVAGPSPSLQGGIAVSRVGGWAPAAGTKLTVLSGSSVPSVTGTLAVTDTAVTGKFAGPAVSGNDLVLTATESVAVAPGAPGLTGAGGVRSISVTVSPPASPGTAPVTSYRITCTPTCGTKVVASAGRVALTGLRDGTWYSVSAVAVSAAGTSAATSVRLRTTVPAAVAVVPATVVLGRSSKLTVTCRAATSSVRACTVKVRAGKTVVATTKRVALRKPASAVVVKLSLTKAGKALAARKGGVRVAVKATVTPSTGRTLSTTRTVLLRRR